MTSGGEYPLRKLSCLVHICGFPSGGTDLLRNLMNGHPEIFITNELPLAPRLARRFGAEIPGRLAPTFAAALRRSDVYRHLGNPKVDVSQLSTRRRVAVAEIYASMLSTQSTTWKGNKTPQNTENIARLAHLFPEGRFILITRDVRDVCVSWRRKWGKDVLLCAAKWESRMLRGLKALEQLPERRSLVLSFEELLRDPEAISRRICDFLNISYSSRMVCFHEHLGTKLDGKRKYGDPIDRDNTGNWRSELSVGEVRRIEEIAFGGLRRLNYVPVSGRESRPMTVTERCLGWARDAIAILFVGNRYRRTGRMKSRVVSISVILRRRMGLG